MGSSGDREHGNQLHGLYEGPVIDNKDPKKLGRVRVRIPGIFDEGTGWAMPYWPGAGGKKRGGWAVPPMGAEVGVMFKMGDPDHPRYLGGFPGEGEAPTEVEEATPEDAVKVPFVYEGERFRMSMDERPGKERIAIEDKVTGDVYEIDGVKLGLRMKSTSAFSIECEGAMDIKAASLTLNGRTVAPTKKPI